MKLTSWLRRMPQPVAVLADDTRILVPKGPRCWAELAETITTLHPSRISALSASDEVLRAHEFAENGDDGPAPSKSDNTLGTFAKLLGQAYKDGASAQADAYRVSFTELTGLVKLLADRLHGLETAWQQSLASHGDLITQLAEAHAALQFSGEGEDSIIAGLLNGMQAAQAAKQGNKGKKLNGGA